MYFYIIHIYFADVYDICKVFTNTFATHVLANAKLNE